jgi:hypothetical protein
MNLKNAALTRIRGFLNCESRQMMQLFLTAKIEVFGLRFHVFFHFFQTTAPQYAAIILGRDSDGGTMTCLFTDPMVGSHRPLATRRTEVLPQPDGPTTSKRSPGPDSKMMKNAVEMLIKRRCLKCLVRDV